MDNFTQPVFRGWLLFFFSSFALTESRFERNWTFQRKFFKLTFNYLYVFFYRKLKLRIFILCFCFTRNTPKWAQDFGSCLLFRVGFYFCFLFSFWSLFLTSAIIQKILLENILFLLVFGLLERLIYFLFIPVYIVGC